MKQNYLLFFSLFLCLNLFALTPTPKYPNNSKTKGFNWTSKARKVSIPATHLHFDGSNDFVSIPNSSSLSFGVNNLTLEAMVKIANSQDDYSGIITKATSGAFSGIQMVVTNNKLALEFGNAPRLDVSSGLIGTTNLNDNNWHHVACVVDRANNNIKLYVDGVVEANVTDLTIGTADLTTSTPLYIGKERNSATYLESNIDEVRIWNTVRTPEQISSSRNCELQGTETGLLAYYRFNQGVDQDINTAVTTLTDATANANNGTLYNLTLFGTTSNWLAGSAITTGSVIPSAPTVTTVAYNQGSVASSLTATSGGTGLMWYTAASGGSGTSTAPTPDTSTSGTTSYWVSSTNANGCESERAKLVVSINAPATHLNFDGVDDYVSLGNSLCSSLAGKSNMTAEAWIRIPNTTGTKTIIANHSNDTQFNLRILGDKLEGFLGFGTYALTSPAGSITPNTWYHVAMVYDNTSLKLFINGNEVASKTIPPYSIQASNTKYIIGKSAFANETFIGDIDEVRVWGVSLSQAEIVNGMNCELQNPTAGLLAYFQFNQGFDTADNSAVIILNDKVGSNAGTLFNFSLTSATSNWKSGSPMLTGSTCTTLATSNFNNLEDKLVVYPNPTNGIFTINVEKPTSIEIYDTTGKKVLNKEITKDTNNVNISNYSNGVYFVKVQADSSNSTYKIVKQ